MIPSMVFLFLVKDLKNQLTALSEENISLEGHAKKLRTALERAEETQEVGLSVSSGQVKALLTKWSSCSKTYWELYCSQATITPLSYCSCVAPQSHRSCAKALSCHRITTGVWYFFVPQSHHSRVVLLYHHSRDVVVSFHSHVTLTTHNLLTEKRTY